MEWLPHLILGLIAVLSMAVAALWWITAGVAVVQLNRQNLSMALVLATVLTITSLTCAYMLGRAIGGV